MLPQAAAVVSQPLPVVSADLPRESGDSDSTPVRDEVQEGERCATPVLDEVDEGGSTPVRDEAWE